MTTMTIEGLRRQLKGLQKNARILNIKLARNLKSRGELISSLREKILAGQSTGDQIDDFIVVSTGRDPVAEDPDSDVAKWAKAMRELDQKVKQNAGGPVLVTWYKGVCTEHVMFPTPGHENVYRDELRFAVGKLSADGRGLLISKAKVVDRITSKLPTEAYVEDRSRENVHKENLGELGAEFSHFDLGDYFFAGKGSVHVGAEEIAAFLDQHGGFSGNLAFLIRMFLKLDLPLPESKYLHSFQDQTRRILRLRLDEIRLGKANAVNPHSQAEADLIAEAAGVGIKFEEELPVV